MKMSEGSEMELLLPFQRTFYVFLYIVRCLCQVCKPMWLKQQVRMSKVKQLSLAEPFVLHQSVVGSGERSKCTTAALLGRLIPAPSPTKHERSKKIYDVQGEMGEERAGIVKDKSLGIKVVCKVNGNTLKCMRFSRLS